MQTILQYFRNIFYGNLKFYRFQSRTVYEADALKIRQALGKRLEKFKLQLNEEKTKLIPFDKRAAVQGVKQGTFDFLGFTFYWGRSQAGWVIPKLQTRAKTMRTKLKRVNEWAKLILFPGAKLSIHYLKHQPGEE